MTQTPRQLWAEVRLQLHAFQTMKEGDETWDRLTKDGLNSCVLSAFIKAGCPRKDENATPLGKRGLTAFQDQMVEIGGVVSGGSAVRRILGKQGLDRDLDIFFPSIEIFARAHLAALNHSNVDLCLYRNEPWEFFDLEASCCAIGSLGSSYSPGFEKTWKSGVSDIRLSCIVHPLATLRRIDKYGTRYGLKFPGDKMMLMATSVSASDSVIVGQALSHRC